MNEHRKDEGGRMKDKERGRSIPPSSSFVPPSSSFILPPSSFSNPFPGLRPFRSDEHHLFFGREDQTAALLQLLRQKRFLAVVGTSGSGKSSLVRAGMIAELYGGTMTQAGSTWEVIILRPGGSPIENLARAMVEADLYDAEDASTLPRLRATLSRSRFGLVEAVKQSDVFESDTNLLVVVDQFEELFRFRQQGIESEQAATSFVNLLLTAAEQAERAVYVAITMRSDYLGDCSEIPGLAEAVNEGEYLIPRLLRDQKRDAIEKPIGVGGAKISPLLVQRLLNDVGDDPDQLPVLQHALMRMWEVWSAGNDHRRSIDFSDFEATGGFAAALSNHADEIYDALPDDSHRLACERIFKTLTVKGEDNRGIRRPTRLSTLQAIADSDRKTVIEVLDAFRSSGVTFLMPGTDVELGHRTVVDLSHESLMRGWQRLRTWVEEEAQSARIFRRVLDTARLWREGKAGLFRDPDLQIALSWREAEHPNAEWAEQYGGDFQTAIHFLETSNADAEAERQAKEAAQKRELEHAQRLAEAERQRASEQARSAVRLRWMVRGVGLVAMVAVAASVFAWVARQESRRNAEIAVLHADEAKSQRTEAVAAREKTEQALKKAESAEGEALKAEQRSREFRYATDMQLAATLVADETASAGQILDRLADHDPGQNKELIGREDLRGFEWHYLNRLVQDRANVFTGIEKEVVETATTPEGELVTLDADARLQRWNSVTRQETQPAIDLKKGRPVSAKTLSRDGRRVALAIGSRVHLFDAKTGEEETRTLPVQARNGLIFTSDSRMVIALDTGLSWWDVATGKPIAVQDFRLAIFRPEYQFLSVSEDALTVVVGGIGDYRSYFSVFRMNPATREVTQSLDRAGERGTKRAVEISPDGKFIAASLYFAGGIFVYDATTGKQVQAHASAHASSISSLAFSSQGTKLVTAAMDGSIKVWDDYKQLQSTSSTVLVGHAEQVNSVCFTSDGKQVISAGKDKTVRLWNLDRKNTTSLHRQVAGAMGDRARYSPDGRYMAVAREPRPQLRDSVTGEIVATLFNADQKLNSSSDSVAFSRDGRLFAAGYGGAKDMSYVELWDIERAERLAVLPGTTAIPGFETTEYTGLVTGLAFSPNGKHLVAGFGSLLMLSSSDQGNHPLVVYDVAARRVVRRLEGPRNNSVSVTFSLDGSRLACACYDGMARIWDTATWKVLHVLSNPDTASDRGQRRVNDVAFSPDGKLLAMASAESHVIIWDATTGEHLQTLRGHANEVWSVAFSPDGRTLASGSFDGTVRLWNTATWRELVRLDPGLGLDVRSLSFSPDGTRLLAASVGEGALVWSVLPEGSESGPTLEQLRAALKLEDGFRNLVQRFSENLRLHQALEQLAQETKSERESSMVQAALAATRANQQASRQDWKPAVEQFDRLNELSQNKPESWLRIPGLVRLATALLHQDRATDGAGLLAGGEERRAERGNGGRSTGLGFALDPGEMPPKLSRVFKGSPAARAGLRKGDRLLKFDDVEFTDETLKDFLKKCESGALFTLTIQREGQDKAENVIVSGTSHIQDDLTVDLIETLKAAVEKKLADSPQNPSLLELRAELAAQLSDSQQQVADYTAAIDTIARLPQDSAAADLQRLYRRRGDAHANLKQWQLAHDDFAKGITADSNDEDLLARQAMAQTEIRIVNGSVQVGAQNQSQGISLVDYRDDGATQPSTVDGQACLRIETGPKGIGHAYFAIDNEIKWTPDSIAEITMEYWDDGPGLIELQYDSQRDAYERHPNKFGVSNSKQWKTVRFALTNVRFANSQNGYADFRFLVSADHLYFKRVTFRQLFPGLESEIPWVRLAAIHRSSNDLAAIDTLAAAHPKFAGPIGDLFTGEKGKDWPRAVAIYSLGITPDTTDAGLYAKRAKAYEELNDWKAAAADWTRAAGENPAGAKALADFATRLFNAGQKDLAETQRQRARQLLEGMLATDPDDSPAADTLAQLLFDMSEAERQWTAVKPAELKTAGGATVSVQESDSLLVERETDGGAANEHKADSLPLLELPAMAKAIRIETAGSGQPASSVFREYRIQAIDGANFESRGVRGQFVRLDLPGDSSEFPRLPTDGLLKTINLAELQVFQGNQNIALRKKARQSSNVDNENVAERGVDGVTTDNAHTSLELLPWWEVDLGSEQVIDRIVVWNRPDANLYSRMNHFRIRVLNSAAQVVFEQVSDQAPSPNKEISCKGLLIAKNPPANGAAPQWSLNLGLETGVEPGRRFRISAAQQLDSLESEDTIPRARIIPDTASRLAVAYAVGSATVTSADWFIRALDELQSDSRRQVVLQRLQNHPNVVAELVRRRPENPDFQITAARSHVDAGQKKLAVRQPAEAVAELQQASNIFKRLLDQNPQPAWTVLQPTELKSEGSTLRLLEDNSILASGKSPDEDTYTLVAKSELEQITALRLEALPHPSLPKNGPGRAPFNGNFNLNELRISSGDVRIPLQDIAVTFDEKNEFQSVIDGKVDSKMGWSVHPKAGQSSVAVIATKSLKPRNVPLKIELYFSRSVWKQHNLGRFRLSVSGDVAALNHARVRFKLPDSELIALDAAIGKAYAQQNKSAEAAAAFARALERAEREEDRKPLIEELQEYPATLAVLAERRLEDLPLQLAAAKSYANSGKAALAEQRQEEALPQLAKARDLFSRLAAEHPESEWTVLHPTEMKSDAGADVTLEADGSIFVSGADAAQDAFTLSAPLNGRVVTGIHLETLPDSRLPNGGSSRNPGGASFLLTEFKAGLQSAGHGVENSLTFKDAFADFEYQDSTIFRAIDSDDSTYWSVNGQQSAPHSAIFTVDFPPGTNTNETLLKIRMAFGASAWPQRNLGRFRLSVTSDPKSIQATKLHQELKASGLTELEISVGNALGRQARIDEAAAAFAHALDLAIDRDARAKILEQASAHAGVFEKVSKLRSASAPYYDALARYFQDRGDVANGQAAAAQAIALYEQQLAGEPTNSKVAKDLADFILEVSSSRWTTLKPTDMKSEAGTAFKLLDDGSILVSGQTADKDVYTITTPAGLKNIHAIRLEAIPDPSLPLGSSGLRPTDGNFALTEFKVTQSIAGRPDSGTAIRLTRAECDYSQPHSPVSNALDGKDNTFWDILPHIHHRHYAIFHPETPVTMTADGILTFNLEFKLALDLGLGRFRLSATDQHVHDSQLAGLRVTNPWLRLGVAYQICGDGAKATTMFVRAIELAKTDQAKTAAAQEAAAIDDLFSQLLERFPTDKSLRLGKAKAVATNYIQNSQYQSALDVLSGAIADLPNDIELLNQRAATYMKLAQWQSADSDYARIIALEVDDGKRRAAERSQAECWLRQGRFEEAAALFLQDMQLSPTDYYRIRDACMSQLLAGQLEMEKVTANRFYARYSSTKDTNQARWLLRAVIAQPGLITNANRSKLLELAKTLDGASATSFTAAIQYRSGNRKLAEPLLTTSKDKAQFESMAAMLLYDQGKVTEARALLKTSWKKWCEAERAKDPPSAIPVQRSWQEWSADLAGWREATRKLIGPRITQLDELLAKEADKVPALLERARLLTEAGLHEEALQDFNRLVALKVDTVEVNALHGRLLASSGHADEALPHINQAIAAGSQDASVYATRGVILLKQGKVDLARTDLERSLELAPTEIAATALGDLLLAGSDKAITWTVLKPTEMTSKAGAVFKLDDDGSILASGTNMPGDLYSVSASSDLDRIVAVRLEALPDPSLPKMGPGRHSTGNFQLQSFRIYRKTKDGRGPLPVESAYATYCWQAYNADVLGTIDEKLKKVWHVWGRIGEAHQALFQIRESADEKDRPIVVELLHRDSEPLNLGRFRLSVSGDSNAFERERARLDALKATDPWLRLALALMLSGDTSRAAPIFAHAFQQTSDITLKKSVYELAAGYAQVFERFVQLLKDDPYFSLVDGNRLAAKGQWNEAAAAYQKAIAKDPGIISGWVQAGFWTVERYPSDLRSKYPPEVEPDPFKPVATVRVAGRDQPEQLKWESVVATNDLITFVSQDSSSCNYALTHVWSPIEQEVAFQMGDDDQMRLFVNHQLLFESPYANRAKAKEYELVVSLRAGWNTVLFKIRNGSGPSSVILTISKDPQDLIAARVGNRLYQAQQLLEAKKRDEAVMLLTSLVESHPANANVFARRADAYKQLKKWDLAEIDCRKAIELDPKNPERWNALADAHQSQQEWEPAVAAYAKSLELQKNNNFVLTRRATCYEGLRRWDEALADYDNAIATRTDQGKYPLLNSRANLKARRGEWQSAASDLQQIFDAGADASKTWTAARDLALARLIAGDMESYRKAAEELFLRSSGDLNADQAKWLAIVYIAAPEMITDKNRERLTLAASKADDYWNPRLQAALRFRSGEFQQAADLFDTKGGGAAFHYLAALANHRLGRVEQARQLFDQGNTWVQQQREDGMPKSSISWLDWMTVLSLQRETSRLLAGPRLVELNTLLTTEPSNIPALLERAGLLAAVGLQDEALKDLNMANQPNAQENLNLPEVAALRVRVLPSVAAAAAERTQVDLARKLYEQLVKLQLENGLWKERLGQLRPGVIAAWNFDAGAEPWSSTRNCELSVKDGVLTARTIGSDPQMSTTISAPAAGKSLVLRYRSDEGCTAQLYWSDSTGGFTESNVVTLRIPAASEWREVIIPFSTQGVLSRLRLDLDSAREHPLEIDSIVLRDLEPEDVELLPAESALLTRFGIASQSNGRGRESLLILTKASLANPGDTLLSMKVAALYAWFGQDKEFALARQRVLAFAKDDNAVGTPNRAAKVCSLVPSTDPAELQAALVLARKAVELGKGGEWNYLALGMAEYRTGSFAVAEKALRDAVAANPKNIHVLQTAPFYRAMCLFRLGQTDEARKVATEAAIVMKPLPADEQNPLIKDADHDHVIQWLAYREAKALIQFEPASPPKSEK